MKRFLKWISIIFVIFLVFIFVTYWIISSLLDTEPYVYSNSYLYISLYGELPEYIPYDGLEEFFDTGILDMYKIRKSLKMAAVDERIKAVILKINPLFTGYAKIQEIQQLITDFQKSGKKVYAHFDLATTKEYYLSTACDSIYLTPEGIMFLTGIRAELLFYKGLFNEIGIEADFEHVGKYKSAPDVYTRQSMSDFQREAINHILDIRYDEIISTISQKRNISANRVDDIINNISGLTPEEALENNMVDGLKYFDDVIDLISEKNRPHKISATEYCRLSPSSLGLYDGAKIAVVYCSGTITGGDDSDDPVLGKTVGSARVSRNIRAAADRQSVKAIILRIDSPGGSGTDSDNILNSIEYAKQYKPVIASISDLGASGGYYIAMGADTIISQSSSIIGSIGVFAGKFSLENLFNKWGINPETIQRGKNANMFSLTSKFSASERKVVRKIITDFYNNFVKNISIKRKMTLEETEKISQGRVWTGADGIQIGLIDTTGGLDLAISLAKLKAGIDQTEDPHLLIYPRKKSFLNRIVQNIAINSQNEFTYVNKFRELIKKWELKPLVLLPYKLNFN